MNCPYLPVCLVTRTGTAVNRALYSAGRSATAKWLFWLLAAFSPWTLVVGEVRFEQNAGVLFYGNSMVERLLEHGELEAYLQLAHSGRDLRVRSLAWTGDEVGYRLRPDGFADHLRILLEKWPADMVVLGFGMNESFAGLDGLSEFRHQFALYLREMGRRHPQASLVMLSPIAVEPGGPSDAGARNRDLAAYTDVMAALAEASGARFVDLFSASLAAYAANAAPLTVQGMHLNERGASEMARVIARALLGEAGMAAVNLDRLGEVAKAAAEKSHHVAAVTRIKNAVLYYGQRRRPAEYEAELPRYLEIIEQAEGTLHALVKDPATRFADFPVPSLPSMLDRSGGAAASGSDRGDVRFGAIAAVIKTPAEQEKEFTVAEGYTLNLFASEAEFPELKNPIQMAFDARGRLWVATMPSFPLTEPGLAPNDKILILEDTNRDGRADRCTVFAEGFDVLDGLAFHERGLIVSAQPRLWLLEDTTGDDRADRRTELLRGVDVTDTHHGGMLAVDPRGHVIFCDGVFNRSQFETPFGVVRGVDATTYRLELETGRIQTEWQTLTANPWRVAFDRYGNMFQRYGGGKLKDGLPHTWTPLGAHHAQAYGDVLNYSKSSAVSVVSSRNFPDEYQQALVYAGLLGNYAVQLSKTSAETGPFVATENFELFSSRNPAFRPVDIEFGLDGAMYVADFCTVLIGQGPNPTRDTLWDNEHGRIWRVVYDGRPVVTDWPEIESGDSERLLALLKHPQDLVRQHARRGLRALGDEIIPALDSWVAAQDSTHPTYDQSLLEALWIYQANREVRPGLMARLMASGDPLYRAAAVQMIRFQFDHLPNARDMLAVAGQDPHPRTRMAAINVISHLRSDHPDLESVLTALHAAEDPVIEMLATLTGGTKPARGRSIPVLEIAPDSEVVQWLPLSPSATADEMAPRDARPAAEKAFQTFIEAGSAQTALLSVTHGFLDVYLNGVQLLAVDYQYNREHQLVLELEPGLNSIEIIYRRLAADPPPVFIYDSLGQPLTDARLPQTAGDLNLLSGRWAAAHAADEGALRVQAVPHLMQFAPTELRVKAGQPVRIIFENPDLMPHNLILIAPGTADEIGFLADQMAATAEGFARQFIPDSPNVLQATPLVNPAERYELTFVAPTQPGRYPYLCTYPGHWRMMRGVLIVE